MMKRLLSLALTALLVVGVNAQGLVSWGVEAGLNVNTISFSFDDFKSSNRMGFFVGPKVKVDIPLLGFGADIAAIYSLNGSRVKCDMAGSTYSAARNLSYLEVPLNLRYDLSLRVVGIYVATGPQYNYCLSGEGALEDLYGTSADAYSRSTWGWNVGAGIEIMKKFQVGFTYTIPISQNGELSTTDMFNVLGNYKQKTMKVRLAYYF